jgi:hypothetical protein
MSRERLMKPAIDVEKNQGQNELPGEEAIEPMGTRNAQRSPGYVDEASGAHCEDDQPEHLTISQSGRSTTLRTVVDECMANDILGIGPELQSGAASCPAVPLEVLINSTGA